MFLEWNFTCFGQPLCPSSGVFHCSHCNGIYHTGFLTACEQNQNGTSWSCSQVASKHVWHTPLLCLQWKTLDDGQRDCPKQVEFHSKNKFEEIVHLVGFIIMNLSQCTVTWTSNFIYYCYLRYHSITRYNLHANVELTDKYFMLFRGNISFWTIQ